MPSTHIQDRLHNIGQIAIPELGLYHCKTRAYSPTLGRFLQTDPISYEDQVNLYAYVGNDPVGNVDPTGLSCTINSDNQGVTYSIDNPGDLKGKDLEQANEAYTRSVNRLLIDPSREIDISATGENGNTFTETTTAGEVAAGLMVAEVSYSSKSPIIDGKQTRWNASTNSKGNITLYNDGVSQKGDGLERTIIHEGLHTTDANDKLRNAYEARGGAIGNLGRALGVFDGRSFNKAHQKIFKSAAKKLFNIKVP